MSGRTLSLPCGVKGVLYVSKGQRWCAICVATVEPETWPTWINSSAVVAGGGPMNNKLVGIIVQGKTSQRMTKRQKDLSHHRSIHQWFSDQACTATSQVLILGRQNYTITITEKTRLFLRLRNIPPFPYYHENPRVPWWRWGSFILCTRTEGPKETPDISKGVIRTYCFWLEEFAVSIFKHTYRKKQSQDKTKARNKRQTIIFILIRRLTASMNTSNSSKLGVKRNKSPRKKRAYPSILSDNQSTPRAPKANK